MGHQTLVNYLLLNGANVNHKDLSGRGILSTTIFSTATLDIQCEIMKSLLKFNADLNECDENGRTPLILAVQENLELLVEFLVSNQADMDTIDNDCYTAITYAIKNNYANLVDLLLRNNAATHILDKEGRSILSIACSFNSRESLALLMERGLDEMHRDNYGWTPLHEAAYAGHLGKIK
jgi:ankyrin repeat protein